MLCLLLALPLTLTIGCKATEKASEIKDQAVKKAGEIKDQAVEMKDKAVEKSRRDERPGGGEGW